MMNRSKFAFAFASVFAAAANAEQPAGSSGAAEETTAAAKPAKEKEPKHNVSSVARQAIREGLSNADALAKVKEAFPEANTTVASIAWYRNDLRKKGEEFKSPTKPKAEKAEKAAKTDPKEPVKAEKKAAAPKAENKPAASNGFE